MHNPSRRVALMLLAPILFVAALSLACDPQQFEYGEHQRATEQFVAAQSTAYAQSVRATATAEAPAVAATATALAETALAAAPDDIRALHDRFGIVLVRVPAGDFIYGEELPDLGKKAEARYLDAYWIGLTEVTNAQFAAFAEAGGYDEASLWTEEGWQWLGKQYYAGPGCPEDETFNAPELPLTCVTKYEAEAFAAWLSRESGLALRLPAVEEWEKAARGPDGRGYPWGNEEPEARLANYAAALGQTAPAGSRPDGASAYGALDMAGNVAEWTGTRSSFSEQYTVRGGSWFDLAGDLVSSQNRYYEPDFRQNTIGFRLVADAE